MYKRSYYTLFSDPVNQDRQRLAYSTRGAKMMLITEAAYDLITNDLVDYLPDTYLKKLVSAKIIVPSYENELEIVIGENIDYTNTIRGQLNEVIQPTAMCQLGCYYCGQQHTKTPMRDDLIDNLVDRIHLKFTTGGYSGIYLSWFGAEPLMALPQMRSIYAKLNEKIADPSVSIGGKIVTNGLSLKEGIFEELTEKFKIDSIEITLDGLGKYHDGHRYTKSGEGTFDIIYRNLKNMLSQANIHADNSPVIIRCNVDNKNIEGVEPLIRQLARDGLHIKIRRLYFVAIYSWGGNEAHKNSVSKETFAMQNLKWEILKIKLGYPYDPSMYQRKKITCIAVGGDSEVYDAYGNIYNCTEISYADFYAAHDYQTGSLVKDPLQMMKKKPFNDWYEKVRDTSQYPCHHCRILPICGGACPKSWIEGNPACPTYKFSMMQELKLKYLLAKTEPTELDAALDNFENEMVVGDFARLE
jgi:uncharacterized protein